MQPSVRKQVSIYSQIPSTYHKDLQIPSRPQTAQKRKSTSRPHTAYSSRKPEKKAELPAWLNLPPSNEVNRRNFEKEYAEYCAIVDEVPVIARKDDCEKEFCLSPKKNPRDNVLKYPEN